ncbi:Tat pathway signal protein [Streptomyces sp. NBC_01320]|uniref:Tat pathway signal protein n=1 Tax=Streptomyces sp. NBC_01320 TaxID=2903824 RepID=UPI002E121DE5|nr:Tat pathway signal protein [Streptomyces sp. NBC_01320]
MSNILATPSRDAVRVGAALALLISGAVVSAPTAEAASSGRVCMVNAPRGAYGAGHAAFMIKDRAGTNHWLYGSFGSQNDAPMAGWIRGGTWEQARSHFKKVRDRDHLNRQYYKQYRCVNTADADLRAAQSWYSTVKNRGYNVHTNNCLHATIAAFKGYSGKLRHDKRLPSATNKPPNDYFAKVLTSAGWERKHDL